MYCSYSQGKSKDNNEQNKLRNIWETAWYYFMHRINADIQRPQSVSQQSTYKPSHQVCSYYEQNYNTNSLFNF